MAGRKCAAAAKGTLLHMLCGTSCRERSTLRMKGWLLGSPFEPAHSAGAKTFQRDPASIKSGLTAVFAAPAELACNDSAGQTSKRGNRALAMSRACREARALALTVRKRMEAVRRSPALKGARACPNQPSATVRQGGLSATHTNANYAKSPHIRATSDEPRLGSCRSDRPDNAGRVILFPRRADAYVDNQARLYNCRIIRLPLLHGKAARQGRAPGVLVISTALTGQATCEGTQKGPTGNSGEGCCSQTALMARKGNTVWVKP